MGFLVAIGMALLPYLSVSSMPGPVNACTFYKGTHAPHFMGCAEPRIFRSACWKEKILTRYRGDRSAMYLPDILIEVTPTFGKSMFEHMAPTLKSHLADAARNYQSKTPFPPVMDDNKGEVATGLSRQWHVRILPVPYGGVTLTYPSVKAGGGAVPYPYCFTGISEYIHHQWYLGKTDLPFAMAWAPIGLPVCDGGAVSSAYAVAAAAAQQAAKTAANNILPGMADSPITKIFESAACAYGVSEKWSMARNLMPGSDALSFLKLCMSAKGTLFPLGGLLPREAEVDATDRYQSAVSAAWKFASLVKDNYPGALAGIQFDDKWQLVYPKSSRSHCFRPGAISDIYGGPFELRKPEAGASIAEAEAYVFAIWRDRSTSCQEPFGEADLWKASVTAEHAVIAASCGG